MARCCGGTPRTSIEAGPNITVNGIGSLAEPFVISTDLAMVGVDSDSFNVDVTGAGTVISPWNITVEYTPEASLNDIPDVLADAPTNGQVLSWDSSLQRWKPVAPTTASTGAVSHNSSLSGDGSVGNPLQVVPDAARHLQNSGTGVGLTDDAINRLNRRFTDDTARNSASPAPVLNTISTVNTRPGQVDYWNGSVWLPIVDSIDFDGSGHELMQLSGAYTNSPLTMVVRKFSGATDVNGLLVVMNTALLTGRAGVLTANVVPLGAVGYSTVLTPSGGQLLITARRLDDGALMASQVIEGQITAYVY